MTWHKCRRVAETTCPRPPPEVRLLHFGAALFSARSNKRPLAKASNHLADPRTWGIGPANPPGVKTTPNMGLRDLVAGVMPRHRVRCRARRVPGVLDRVITGAGQ